MYSEYMEAITPIGITNHQNKSSVFGIKPGDRFGHIYSIGKTGTGKSTLLLNMALHDIEHGEGICIIDPHGDLAEKLLDCIPQERIKDVIYLNTTDKEYVVPFNPFALKIPENYHSIAFGIVSAFKKIWSESWGPRLEHILRNTLLTLMYHPNTSLLHIHPLLTNNTFRWEVLTHVTDTGLLSFWRDEFDKYAPAFRNEVIAPILNKVGIFQTSPALRNINGGNSKSIDVEEIMNTRKILIVNLSKGIIGEEPCTILGSLLLTHIQVSALGRARIKEVERVPFHVYVDEAHTFITKSFADILSEARKYKLSLFLTHQYTEQLEEDIRSAIFGNVGTFITFRVGHVDAEIIAKELFPVFTEEDLINLPRYSCYLKLMIDGETSQPFSARTIPPKVQPTSWKETIIRYSREKHGRFTELVEKEMEGSLIGKREKIAQPTQGNLFSE
jgi:Type IV secretion-system coupling protein DNA-binding domain